jgi:protoheme IX farnesyltransferase|tara:strand:- start:1437 stop:2318 length:882 start_codon:yes stop_codon:yes gene_type:complete
LRNKIKDYSQLAKLRLSSTVVFSALVGYLLAADEVDFKILLMLLIGGFLVVASSNGFNQVYEKDTDKLMDRTKERPMPAGRMATSEGLLFSSILGLVGMVILYYINAKSAIFGAAALVLYAAVYTPLKTVSPIAVFVGAFPGAIPFMLGWVAATNEFGTEAGTLFAIQFLWQFPHFWAIAWLLDEDYKKAGIRMLPSGVKDKKSAFQAMLYTIWLIPVSIMPFVFPYIGIESKLLLTPLGAILILLMGVFLYKKSALLLKNCDQASAKKLMFGSLIYLPAIQIIYLLDKYLLQ